MNKEREFRLSVKAEEGQLKINLHEFFDSFDGEEKIQLAEALCWDEVLEEALNRILGESMSWSGDDHDLRLMVLESLSAMEDKTLTTYDYETLNEFKKASEKIANHENAYDRLLELQRGDVRIISRDMIEYATVSITKDEFSKLLSIREWMERVKITRNWNDEKVKSHEDFCKWTKKKLNSFAETLRDHDDICQTAYDLRVSVQEENKKLKKRVKELEEAVEYVVATAHGNSYGLDDSEKLEAMRLAAGPCEEALGEDAVHDLLKRHGLKE